MPLRIIYGRAGTGKTTYCINEIKKKIEKKKIMIIFLLYLSNLRFKQKIEL